MKREEGKRARASASVLLSNLHSIMYNRLHTHHTQHNTHHTLHTIPKADCMATLSRGTVPPGRTSHLYSFFSADICVFVCLWCLFSIGEGKGEGRGKRGCQKKEGDKTARGISTPSERFHTPLRCLLSFMLWLGKEDIDAITQQTKHNTAHLFFLNKSKARYANNTISISI